VKLRETGKLAIELGDHYQDNVVARVRVVTISNLIFNHPRHGKESCQKFLNASSGSGQEFIPKLRVVYNVGSASRDFVVLQRP
jgi:hypothetical protein